VTSVSRLNLGFGGALLALAAAAWYLLVVQSSAMGMAMSISIPVYLLPPEKPGSRVGEIVRGRDRVSSGLAGSFSEVPSYPATVAKRFRLLVRTAYPAQIWAPV
jgi:hypothetical protein